MLCNSIMLRQGSLEGVCRLDGAPGAIRTPDLLNRNQMLYPAYVPDPFSALLESRV